MILAAKHCAPELGTRALSGMQAKQLLSNIAGWELSSDTKAINCYIECKNFAQALELVNKIGVIAEAENHHPDIGLGWGYVDITLMTHDVDGLTENDFIVAAKINELS